MKQINKSLLRYFYPFCIVLLGIVALFDLFHPGLPVTHDGQDHVARIANFYQNLVEGNLIPRWAGNLDWGFGHPILMFLYPLPSYIASLFHFIGFSLIDSTKIVFGLAFIASGLTMYLWTKVFLSKHGALFASLLYMFAPYRFVDLYVRGAIGEHIAFVFLPLLFYFLQKLSKRYSVWYIFGGSLSFAALLLSHNAVSIMFFPMVALYTGYLLWQVKAQKTFSLQIALMFSLGFGLSSFFLLPAYFEGRYTLRDIVTAGAYSDSFVTLREFFYGPWTYGGTAFLSKQVGIVQWVVVAFSLPAIFILYKRKKPLWILTSGMLCTFLISLFLMQSFSNVIWQLITILQKFQFPWRFLSINVFISAFLGGVVFSVIPRKTQPFMLGVLLLPLVIINQGYWHANGYLSKDDSFFTEIYNGTTDTGESAPIWSVRFMEKEPRTHMEVIGGKAIVTEITRSSTKHIYKIAAENKAQLKENTLYFPGWTVLVDGKVTPIEFQDPANRGLITFFVDKGEHTILLKFMQTRLRVFADAISLLSIVSIFFLFLQKRLLWKKSIKKATS